MKVVKTDSTPELLSATFKGQDAIVSFVGFHGSALEKMLIDAAVSAGVKRYIPSQFGIDPTQEALSQVMPPFFQEKVGIVDYLISKESSGLTWTSINTALFTDWALKNGFLGVDIANKKVTLMDGGEVLFSGASLSTIANGVAAVLGAESYEKTKNQTINIFSYTVSQKDVLASIERVGGEKWETSRSSSEVVKQEGEKLWEKGQMEGAYAVSTVIFFGKAIGLGKLTKRSWNDDLGLAKETLDDTVKSVL